MRLSYSQLEWFLRCPYVFKYQFIDKKSLPPGKSAAFGALLHRVMEFLYKGQPLYPTLSEALAFYEKEWQKRGIASLFPTEVEAKVYFNEGMRIIKGYVEKHDLEHSQVLSLEKFFSIPLEDDENGTTHLFTGRIDRVDKIANGLEVIDYKTARTLKTQQQVSTDLQLAIYHMAVASLWPDIVAQYKENIRVSLYFLRHQEKVSTTKNFEELVKTKETLLSYIAEIEDAIEKNNFEARPSPLCQMEPYSAICPYFADRHRKERPKIAGEHDVSAVIQEYLGLKQSERSTKQRLGELALLIQEYLDEQELEGIFDGDTGIVRFSVPRYELDSSKIRDILLPLDKWGEVIDVSRSKLSAIKKELPVHISKKLDEAQKHVGSSKALRVKKL